MDRKPEVHQGVGVMVTALWNELFASPLLLENESAPFWHKDIEYFKNFFFLKLTDIWVIISVWNDIGSCSEMAQALGFRMMSIVFMALITFSSFTLQSCIESTPVGNRMSQSGYATCHNLDYEKHSLLYITGFQRKMGSHNDLRDIKKVKCCQPPGIHKDKPHTCTSADWDLSFSRYVILIIIKKFWNWIG